MAAGDSIGFGIVAAERLRDDVINRCILKNELVSAVETLAALDHQ